VSRFGWFEVVPARREARVDGTPIQVGNRAFEILAMLVEAQGELVTKDDIMRGVWHGAVVEENTLQAHMSALRRALGDYRTMIKTASGRGYRLIAADAARPHGAGPAVGAASPQHEASRLTPLPAPASELIGRDVTMADVASLLTAHRIVTLTGAGGIGKTRLGIEVARHALPSFADGVWLAQFAPASHGNVVSSAVASALGLELSGGSAEPEQIARALGSKQILLMFDNCEHVIDAAAGMADAIVRANPRACVLATSREPLRAEGEWIYRVPPLDVPAEAAEDPGDLLQHGAVRLFLARARAAEPAFSADARSVAILAAVCRRLDGIPLAIELAAARAATLGVEDLASRLDDRFRLLAGGHRTALPRHQTLRATFNWSYELLPEIERTILRRLAVFAGNFTLDAAGAIAAGPDLALTEVIDGVTNLVAKSLVAVAVDGAAPRYRLLETTRAFSLEKLTEGGEVDQVSRRHAEYYRDLLSQAETVSARLPLDEWLARYASKIDNLRASLDWCFSPGGDAAIGVALTVAAVPLWTRLSLMDECRRRVEQALSSLEGGRRRDLRARMQLLVALGAARLLTVGTGAESGSAWERAFRIADCLDDADYRLRALWGLYVQRFTAGDYRAALAAAERFCGVASTSPDPADLVKGERMIGVPLHIMGDQAGARARFERSLGGYAAPVHGLDLLRFQFDERVVVRCYLSRTLWLQGLAEQGLRLADESVRAAQAIDHPVSLFYALIQAACPVALFAGDLAMAERYVAQLLDLSVKHAATAWNVWGRCFKGVLSVRRGDAAAGLHFLRAALGELSEPAFHMHYITFQAEVAAACGRIGGVGEGLAVIDRALARSEHAQERWCVSELLRIKSELLLQEGSPGAESAAEDLLRQALHWAHQQQALSFELRAAIALARLLLRQDRRGETREFLRPIYARFTEGFATTDLNAAKALLDTAV
jgi:predicted ATPase/DNA-binding winged helix-turn-helix (wHTH) protein